MQKRRGHCTESDVRRISEKYLTCNKRKTSGHSAKLGTRCPIMQSVASLARSWTSGVRPDVRGMSEKYLSHNTSPVYKLRLGRPSRLPSMFINFEMDPYLCSFSQNIYCIYKSKTLPSNSAWMCLSITIQLSTLIHPLPPSC